MNSLLDTDVLSQRVKASPDERVVRWLSQVRESELFLSVVSFLEIRLGVEQMAFGRKRHNLDLWIRAELPRSFADRILPVDAAVADTCGTLLAVSRKAGHTPKLADALIAATARVHGLRMATLNRKDFVPLGVEFVQW